MIETTAAPAHIALLTHASNDLTVLHQARAQLPSGFGGVAGVNLQSLDADTSMAVLLEGGLRSARVIHQLRKSGNAAMAGI